MTGGLVSWGLKVLAGWFWHPQGLGGMVFGTPKAWRNGFWDPLKVARQALGPPSVRRTPSWSFQWQAESILGLAESKTCLRKTFGSSKSAAENFRELQKWSGKFLVNLFFCGKFRNQKTWFETKKCTKKRVAGLTTPLSGFVQAKIYKPLGASNEAKSFAWRRLLGDKNVQLVL